MKTNSTLLFFGAMVLSVTGNGQDQSSKNTSSGKIAYTEKAKIEIKIEGDAAQFADQLPKEHVESKVLFFNPDYTLYRADDKIKAEDEMSMQSGTMKIRMINAGESDKIFYDLKNNKKTEQKEFMTRLFLVESTPESTKWKISENFITILGYNCQEASWQDSVRTVKAWFTTAIPVSAGPAGYGGLPGMILQIDINNGKRTITASAIDPALNVSELLVKPKEGKKTTPDEYKKMVDEKMKEMGVENGQQVNQVFIRHIN